MKYTIATLASHSCLQILKGAKDEGFATLAIAIKDRVSFYKRFTFIDEIISLNSYKEFLNLGNKLKKKNVIIIPHGSFVAYLKDLGKLSFPFHYFGNKKILDIEADRIKQHNWLINAGLKLPKIFQNIREVDRPVIVKLYGAKGGSGYFLAGSRKELREKIISSNFVKKRYLIQEYIIGIPVYLQYFYSPIFKRIELLGVDRRYESNVDGIGRLPASFQEKINIDPSYTVIGNFPIVLRESLLPKVYEMGEKIVAISKKLAPPKGLYGPFCLETVITTNQEFYCIEISCRIVAGTNLYINGSPYTDLFFKKPMSTGRRIACEIKEAIKQKKLDELLD